MKNQKIKVSSKSKVKDKSVKKVVPNYSTIRTIARKYKKKIRTLKGKIVVLNSKGKIHAHCKETTYGIAWRAPSRKKELKTGFSTTRIEDKKTLENVILKIR